MANTPLIGMPLLAESQAGKFLLINQNFRILEALQNNSAKSSTLQTQPDAPEDGDTYILPAAPTGAQWSLYSKDSIAIYVENAWYEVVPNLRARYEFDIADETDTWRSWNGTAWVDGRMSVGTGSGIGSGSGPTQEVPAPTDAYKFYRFEISTYFDATSSTNTHITEFELFDEADTNIATTGTATASGTRSGYSPANAINGDRNAVQVGGYPTHWISTDGVGPHWLQVELPTSTPITKFAIILSGYGTDSSGTGFENWRLLGSNDGTNFDQIASGMRGATEVLPSAVFEHGFTTTVASAAYRYIRLRVTEAIHHGSTGFEFAVIQRVHLRNASNTDVAEASTVTASSTYAGYSVAAVTSTGGANWANGAAPDEFITFDLGAGNTEVVSTYEIRSAADSGNAAYYPVSWVLEGSHDGATYTEIDSKTGQSFGLDETKAFTVSAPVGTTVPINGIRVNVTANNGDTYVQFGELQFRQTAGTPVDHSGDTAFHSSIYSAPYPASNLSDDVAGTVWASQQNAGFPQYAGYLLVSSITDLGEVLIETANGGEPANAPTAFTVQVSSDTTDGHDGTWTDIQDFTVTNPGINEVKLFAVTNALPATATQQVSSVDIGSFVDDTPVASSGNVAVNSPTSLTFNIDNISSGTNGLAAKSSNTIDLVGGDTFEIEADWQSNLDFYQQASARWLAIGLLQETIGFPTTQWFYQNPYRSTSNTGIGFWFGPVLPPSVTIDGVTQSGVATAQWTAQALADLVNPTNVKLSVAPEATADSKVSIWLKGSATPDEHVITGWRLSGSYKLVVWVSDYASTQAVNVTNIALRKS